MTDIKKRRPGPGRGHIAKFDYDKLREIMQFNPTLNEVASFFGVHKQALYDNFKRDPKLLEIMEQGRNNGKISLRRQQWRTAMEGNVPMQIWLGKQWLEQSDKQDISQTTDQRITFTDIDRKKIAEAILSDEA